LIETYRENKNMSREILKNFEKMSHFQNSINFENGFGKTG
jgi:hypothetical protein